MNFQTSFFEKSQKFMKKKVLNFINAGQYKELYEFASTFNQDQIDALMTVHGQQIFEYSLFSLEALEIIAEKVSPHILQKLLSHQEFKPLHRFLHWNMALLNREAPEEKAKRRQSFQILLKIDRLGVGHHVKTSFDKGLIAEEIMEDFKFAKN